MQIVMKTGFRYCVTTKLDDCGEVYGNHNTWIMSLSKRKYFEHVTTSCLNAKACFWIIFFCAVYFTFGLYMLRKCSMNYDKDYFIYDAQHYASNLTQIALARAPLILVKPKLPYDRVRKNCQTPSSRNCFETMWEKMYSKCYMYFKYK